MSAPDIDALRRLAAAATPGPWSSAAPAAGTLFMVRTTSGELVTSRLYEEDAAFVAAARADVPALCDEVERLRGIVREAAEAWKRWQREPRGTGEEIDAGIGIATALSEAGPEILAILDRDPAGEP